MVCDDDDLMVQDTDTGLSPHDHALSISAQSDSDAEEHDYPNRLPGFSKQCTGMVCQDDSDDDVLMVQHTDPDCDISHNRLHCPTSVAMTEDSDDDESFFPNLLSTLPDPTDTFPNHKSRLHFCIDCGSTAGPGNCKCERLDLYNATNST